MYFRSALGRILVFVSLLAVLGAGEIFAQDNKWRPVTQADLTNNTPVVEADADAEAIFWEVRVDDSDPNDLGLQHYVRVKVFTERGRDNFAKHDVAYGRGMRIKNIEARVTKPDGTVVQLRKEDIFERDIVRASGLKVKAKSFALPGIEVGSVVEYKYREMIESGAANMRLILQRELPMRSVAYYIKPFPYQGLEMRYERFNVGSTTFEKDKGGFHKVSMTNVPAFREEPTMLPEDEVKRWIYIYYADPTLKTAQNYWKNVSKNGYEAAKGYYKVNDDVKATTERVTAGGATEMEKLRKIYDFVKAEIRNLTFSENVTDDEWKRIRNTKSGPETLKMKMGSASDVDYLFGSMARAAGFDARLAYSGDRSELFFKPEVANSYLMLNSSSVAVKVGNEWKFFSPAAHHVPFGMLSWREENQTALITDPKELIWAKTPLSGSELSLEKRAGKFKLLEDGTLEGEARIELTGHRGFTQKLNSYNVSPAEREKALKEWIKSNILGSAEMDAITIQNVSDPEKPFTYSFKVKIPGYASRTGKRIFLQPNVFERSSQPRFTSSTRKYDVYFQYPFSEQDDIVIELPPGFTLENADAPGTVRDQQGIGSLATEIRVSKDGRVILYKRKFSFANGGSLQFPVESYTAIKQFFEAFHKADTHQLTLRQATP